MQLLLILLEQLIFIYAAEGTNIQIYQTYRNNLIL